MDNTKINGKKYENEQTKNKPLTGRFVTVMKKKKKNNEQNY